MTEERRKKLIKIMNENPPEGWDDPFSLNSENTEQATSSDTLMRDTGQLGTGCSSFASGATENSELGAEPLGHKIEAKEDWYCPTCDAYLCGEQVSFEEYHVTCGTYLGNQSG